MQKSQKYQVNDQLVNAETTIKNLEVYNKQLKWTKWILSLSQKVKKALTSETFPSLKSCFLFTFYFIFSNNWIYDLWN